ncbi:hypothetical protein TSAR_004634 [Trichomalopsis sarcophagae]|uniref:Gamma-tubulin complex component 6 n=1 Tax=Trichomalopsis sarcophagae TaxID=543379 RepID=A0A232FBK8_9HYME|nr:hypothetical protein TSAR_004634 [Trichomalopsis sarcophagae]
MRGEMEPEPQDNDVYGLVRGLCENLFRKHHQAEEHPYLPQQDNEKHLRRFKAKAYEILLNKSGQDYAKHREPCDPIVELLKHAYVLKVGVGRVSQAAELEKYLDEFIGSHLEPDSVVYRTLQFLNCLKSVDFEDETSLDIFYYGRPHPSLPEMLYDEGGIPPFQVYPCEAFHLPKKFETMFKQEQGGVIRYNAAEPGSKLALLNRFTSPNSHVQNTRHNYHFDTKMSNIPRRTTQLLNGTDVTLSSYFIPQIKDVCSSEDQFQVCKEGIVTEPESPWQCPDPLQWFAEQNRAAADNPTEIREIEDNDADEELAKLDKVWEQMDKFSSLSSHRTWETLGSSDPSKEPPFVSESVEATLHLVNVAQSDLFPDQIVQVSRGEFISNMKLLLLGVESTMFMFNPATGFELKKNLAVQGVSARSLENLSYEVCRWGTCFRNLSDLTVPDSRSGKLRVEGLIFKALCSSIKEFLLFYHAAILKVSLTDASSDAGLLSFLNKVRPLGGLILRVAELCRCDSNRASPLGEGIGILTHIYKEVTKVTEQRVALVFYSILRECCEVYFRFLQHWIFEGVCADIYEEFMIRVRPQYLRTQGHRFWTRAFSINRASVPGFLSRLTDTILQCGKAVTLLKICDPQNPVCRVSASSQPRVKVCLSVGMLREQARFYEAYEARGEHEQGEEVSLSSAIRDEKEAERRRAELVIAAQQDTLQRLRREREDALRKISKEKSDLLEQLKDQAEEAAQRRIRDRDKELMEDKLLLEDAMKMDEEAKNAERIERESTIKYYEELAEEAKRHRIHADWRIRRMKLFDERVAAIASMRREFINTPEEPKDFLAAEKDEVDPAEGIVVSQPISDKPVAQEQVLSEDENSNPTSVKLDDPPVQKNKVKSMVKKLNAMSKAEDRKNQNVVEPAQTTSKPVRPTVLDISSPHRKLSMELTDNLSAAQRNKLKVLQSEFGIITPNNNAPATILRAMENEESRTELTETQMNRLRNTKHLTNLNWENIEGNENLKKHLESAEIQEGDQTEIQLNRLRNTQHLTHLNWENIESIENLKKHLESGEIQQGDQTEIQLNRLRNTQHLTHLNWENIEENENLKKHDLGEIPEGDKTEIQMNRLRNTQHLTHLNWNDVEGNEQNINLATDDNTPLTDAQINRNRVMSHFYSRMDELEEHIGQPKSENLTACQKNRNRNMAHNTDQFDFEINRFTEREQQQHHLKETPMSTNTDHFTISTHSGSGQVHSCGNTPFSEITNHSDMLRSTDGMSTDETSQRSRGSRYFQETPAYPEFIGLGSAANTPSIENQQQQLTVDDVEMIDSTSLQVYLEKSVIIPLRVQSRLVNNAIIKVELGNTKRTFSLPIYLLNEHKMLSHLHSLRSYFFLLNGEFAKTLTQSLFRRLYEVSSPLELFNSSTLSNFLEKALVSSLSGSYANSELLSLSAADVPTYLQTSNPEILSCLSLNYKISWPLNIVFNDVVMQQYSRVFKFLLMVGRVLWVLQEDFQILKIERKAAITENHHKLQLYRHSMMQFMNALHTYLTCSVLHASWSEFERELESATTLDEVYETHVSYIKKILSRCMLNVRGEKMRTCLCNIFMVVLKFHNRIRAQDWSGAHPSSTGPNYENLEKMYVTFCEQRTYLAHVAEKLANSGYQPHLMQFLHALNINHRYDLASKK